MKKATNYPDCDHQHDAHDHHDARHQQDALHVHVNAKHTHYVWPFFLIFSYAIVEVIGGVWTGSLALLSDAGHMFSDVAALGLAWFGAVLASKPNAKKHASNVTYAEITVSIINALTMLIVIMWILFEAVARLKAPQVVKGMEVMVIAFIGLIVNLIVAKKLHQSAHDHGSDLNNRAALLHVLGDLLGSVTAIAAGLVIYFTGWMQIDAILSIVISLLLTGLTLNLIKDIWRTLRLKEPAIGHDGHHHH
jgi:cobalt-zinc-cadmium efflux system protein